MMAEIGDRHYKPEELDEASARRMRLIRAGLRNKDQETLDVVKAEFVSIYGELLGGKVFDDLLFREMFEMNKAQIDSQYPPINNSTTE